MKLVIDTNRIIAALVKDSASRKIIMTKNFEFLTPDYTLEEIRKYTKLICEKAGVSEEVFETLMFLVFEKIEIIPTSEYKSYIVEAKKLIKDVRDVPFIACSFALKTDGIWSDDEHFQKQRKIKVFRTRDLIPFV